MKDHYVVCGYGRVGRRVADDLRHRGELTVVIESQTELLDQLKESMIPFVPGNATSDEVLRAAGVERAKGLIVGLPDEADTLFVTLSARQMNPGLRIVARSDEVSTNEKLRIAGADAVVCPHDMGGERMALAVSQPDVLGYVRIGEDGAGHPIRIDQLRIDSASPLCGMEVGKLPLQSEFDVTLIALQKSGGDLLRKLRPDDRVEEDDVLVLMGASDKLMLLQHALPRAQAAAPA